MKVIESTNQDKYKVYYDPAVKTVFFEGTLRLNGIEDYASISALLEEVFQKSPRPLILNLKKLEFLNSSGISVFARFVINIRNTIRKSDSPETEITPLKVIGSSSIPWQGKSLPNLKKLYDLIELSYE